MTSQIFKKQLNFLPPSSLFFGGRGSEIYQTNIFKKNHLYQMTTELEAQKFRFNKSKRLQPGHRAIGISLGGWAPRTWIYNNHA